MAPDMQAMRADGGRIADAQPDLIATLLLEQRDPHTPAQGAVT